MSQSISQIKEQLGAMSVKRHAWGAKRSGSRQENRLFSEAIESDERQIGTWKKVIDTNSDDWKALMESYAKADRYWKANSFPYVVEGVRLFHRDRRAELIAGLGAIDKEMKDRASVLDGKREQIIEWAKKTFPKTFDESVYPKSWRECFGVSWTPYNIDPPQYLERDDAEEYKRELARGLANVEQGMKQFESQCMSRMAQVAYNLGEALTRPTNQGLGQNVKGMLELFDQVQRMRFEGTAAFEKCLKETKELIEGVEVEEIKKKGGVRDEVRNRLKEIVDRNKKLRELVEQRAKEKKT